MPAPLRVLVLAALLVAATASLGIAGGLGAPRLDLVVLGDSFTAALDMQALRDDPNASWATGTSLAAPSIAQRLQADGWDVRGTNLAVSGHRLRDAPQQLQKAPASADLVLVWLGTNDLCSPRTSFEEILADAQDAFQAIRLRYPEARVLIFAPPSLETIRNHQQGIPAAVELWAQTPVCGDFFAPRLQADHARARQQEVEAAVEVAARQQGFGHSRALNQLDRPLHDWADWDYFHPSASGAAWLAELAWPDVRAAATMA